tara:strand:+ start:307 stop:591 length:285 start_codon:yes stop_codon:yes gene_type:complete
MPLEVSAFPHEVQVAFFVHDLLSDKWDGASGNYLGKDWSSANFIFKTFNVEDVPTVVYFAKIYENLIVHSRLEENSRKQKAEERRAKAKSSMSR